MESRQIIKNNTESINKPFSTFPSITHTFTLFTPKRIGTYYEWIKIIMKSWKVTQHHSTTTDPTQIHWEFKNKPLFIWKMLGVSVTVCVFCVCWLNRRPLVYKYGFVRFDSDQILHTFYLLLFNFFTHDLFFLCS